MKAFLKENIFFFALLGTLLSGALAMGFYSCKLEEDVTAVRSDLQDSRRQLEEELSRQSNFNDVAPNLAIAKEDSMVLAKSRLTEINKLMRILSKGSFLSEAERKSSQDVNSDLQRFIRLYREKLAKKGIKLKGSGASADPSLSFPAAGGGNQESFGFSKYDGQWPSFDVEEAREIYKQKQIILRLLDYLIEAKGNDPSQPLELISIKRELVGKEDSKKRDQETLPPDSLKSSLAKSDKILTYSFRIELMCRTSTLRNFLSQLTPPFLVSDIQVERATGDSADFSQPQDIPLPFDIDTPKEVAASIPIITDVNSRFQITLQFLVAIQTNPEQFLRDYYNKKDQDGALVPPPVEINDFLTKQVFDIEPDEFTNLLETVYSETEE